MVILSPRWQQYYMRLAREAATASKDGSSKFGAVLVRRDKTVASIGFNGFPARIKDDFDILNDSLLRKDKLCRITHAEENCLNHSRDHDTTGYHMVVNGFPCERCALRIVSTNIAYLYYEKMEDSFVERWKPSLDIARKLFDEAGLELIEVN